MTSMTGCIAGVALRRCPTVTFLNCPLERNERSQLGSARVFTSSTAYGATLSHVVTGDIMFIMEQPFHEEDRLLT
jgi:hypothetical protein